jgi:drug/metabolite transporter (DMT)-like permease
MNTSNRGYLIAVLFMTIAVFLFSTMDVLIKFLAIGDYSSFQIIFLRCFVTLFVITPFLIKNRKTYSLKSRVFKSHVLRAINFVAFTGLFIYCFSFLPLTSIYSIIYTAPVIVTLLAMIFLKEKISTLQWVITFIALIGTLIIVQPGSEIFNPATLITLFATVLYSINMLHTKMLTMTDNTYKVVLYLNLLVTIITGFSLPYVWITPSAIDWLIFLGSGLCGGIGQILFTKAFSHDKISLIAPIIFTSILWITIYEWLFWDILPARNILIGASLIIAGNLVLSYREHNKKLT